MAEVAFAKMFLTSLDSRPIKLSPDHIEDPKTFPPRPPYILPRMPTPMSKPSSRLPPGSERSIDITLKSLRNPPLDITLPATPLSTSILDVKAAVNAQTRIPVEKMKLLLNKRPVADTKVLKELLAKESDRTIDFSVMVIGGAAAIPPAEEKAAGEAMETTEEPVATAQADAAAVEAELESDAFWADLSGFLQQRLKAQDKAEELSSLFRSSWQASRSNS
ncbi:get5 carboxyl domain-containing protein [Trichoderma breve]|uniref:Get5 carboxyl domain-containing protein n=1 Tax=Trichoderma breve TaxID=2034170 RepID=A0A9W9BEX0_9HYPO|nr:get5 carboxyl domain-containing protein [Trichoderma breve]KAJ4859095.1 get5 carboxyl domain-containing protein [Trichoderma breve]